MRPVCCAMSVDGSPTEPRYQHPQKWLFHFSPFLIAASLLDTPNYNLRMLQNYDVSFDFLWQSIFVEVVRFRHIDLVKVKRNLG